MNNNKKVIYQVKNYVATLTLNDAKSLNAFGTELSDALLEALNTAESDDNVRVVILQGANDNFSSGGHIKEMLSVGMDQNALSTKLEGMVVGAGVISRKIRSIQKPIIAKLQGSVAGAGFNLALTCDFRIASDDAKFIQSFIHIGLMPDAGGIYLLNQLIGSSKATEFTMLGEIVTADEAYALDLLYQVVSKQDLDNAVDTLASRLVELPKTALATIKKMMNETAFAGLSQSLDMETKNQAMLARTDDFLEGVSAFIEKRPANYVQ